MQITKLILAQERESLETVLMVGNEELARLNIQRGISQGDKLSPSLFVIGLIPVSYTIWKVNGGYQLGKGKHKNISDLLLMVDVKGIAKNRLKDLQTPLEFGVMEFGISKCVHVTMKAGRKTC